MAMMTMPSLLLQSTSRKAKGSENKATLSRRMALWKDGKMLELLKEGETLQKRMETSLKQNKNAEDEIAKKFRNFIITGNVKSAMRLLEKEAASGILPINDDTKELLKEKHPEAQPLFKELQMNGMKTSVDPIIYEEITPELIQSLAIKTNGTAGPSQLNAEEWRKMIGSKIFGMEGIELCKAISTLAKILCTE